MIHAYDIMIFIMLFLPLLLLLLLLEDDDDFLLLGTSGKTGNTQEIESIEQTQLNTTFLLHFIMCIINHPVDKVADTALFAAKLFPLNVDGNLVPQQLTIYSNEVATKTDNQMILPFPLVDGIPEDLQVTLYDISSISKVDFLQALNKMFYISNRSRSKSKARSLPVVEVGSYLVTKCFSIDDLSRVDESVFVLSSGVKTLLEANYSAGFGFLVCKLKQTAASESSFQYEPFAYSHCLSEASANCLFLPTKHFHPVDPTKPSEPHADWDHNIYILNYESGLPGSHPEWIWSGKDSIPSLLQTLQDLTGEFEPCQCYHKCTMKGSHYPNEDLRVTVTVSSS